MTERNASNSQTAPSVRRPTEDEIEYWRRTDEYPPYYDNMGWAFRQWLAFLTIPADVPYREALALLRRECQIDENGDNNCGAEPALGWETGYCAGLRTAYRALKKAAPQVANAAEQDGKPHWPARASSEAGKERYKEALQEILRHHANDNHRPKAFYIAADALDERSATDRSEA